jgi:hypothetical protein
MPKRATFIMRGLALANVLEGTVGMFMLANFTATALDPVARSVLIAFPKSPLAFWISFPTDFAFIALLFVSASLLWRLRKSGLALLAWTLVSESLLFVALSIVHALLVFPGGSNAQIQVAQLQAVLFLLSPIFGIQFVTLYPLLAGLFIYLAYRVLAAPPEQPTAGPASVAPGTHAEP